MRDSLALDYPALADAELAALAQRGDRMAFGVIMQRCNQRLFRIARSIVRDDHDYHNHMPKDSPATA